MADDPEGGVLCMGTSIRIDDLHGIVERKWKVSIDDGGTYFLASSLPNASYHPIFVRIEQHLLASLQGKAVGQLVHRLGGIFEESKATGIAVDPSGQLMLRVEPGAFHLPKIEVHWLLGAGLLPGSLSFPDLSRGRSEGTVIQIGCVIAQQPLRTIGMRDRRVHESWYAVEFLGHPSRSSAWHVPETLF